MFNGEPNTHIVSVGTSQNFIHIQYKSAAMHTYFISLHCILHCSTLLYVLYGTYDFYIYKHIAFELGQCPLCNHKAVQNVCTQQKRYKTNLQCCVLCACSSCHGQATLWQRLEFKVFWCRKTVQPKPMFLKLPKDFFEYDRLSRNLPCSNSSLPYSEELNH